MEPLTQAQLDTLLAAAQKANPGDKRVTMEWLTAQPQDALQASWQRVQQQQQAAAPHGLGAVPGDLWNLIKGMTQVAGAGHGSPQGIGPEGQALISGVGNQAKQAFQTIAEPFLGGIPGSGVAQTSPEDYSKGLASTYGNVLMGLSGGAGRLATPLLAAGAAATNPEDPMRAVGDVMVPVLGTKGAIATGRMASALSPAASAMRQATTAASGVSDAALQAQRALLRTTGREALATPADLIATPTGEAGPLQALLARAAGRNPATAARLQEIAAERQPEIANQRMMAAVESQIGSPSAAGIDAALEAARKEWSNPVYEAVRENGQPVSFARSKPFSMQDALGSDATPEATTALKQAMKSNREFNTWFSERLKRGPLNPADLRRIIPGSEPPPNPIADILNDPKVAEQLPTGIKTLVAAGGDVPFNDMMNAYQNIDRAADAAFRRGDRGLGFHLAEQRTALGDAMAAHESAWGDANAGFRRLARQQEAFQRGVEARTKGNANDIQDAAVEPVNAENPAAFRRGVQSVTFEQLDKSGNAAKAFRPQARNDQALLAATFPDAALKNLMDIARAERGLAAQPTGGASSGEMGMPYPSANPAILAMKAGLKWGLPWMRRSTAGSIGDLLATPGPESLDAFLARLAKARQ